MITPKLIRLSAIVPIGIGISMPLTLKIRI